ncbi:4-(cytidine 5'-diphospho)-2-C-methyl-D-erythritol kinase [Emcibacter nanhaiensis]|uniref:4-diphosphocytidyl-2-C-methyl-D-erythritol kinase n=1 Tax=Emcibacter nanhaiensis TaxID=1505037 RepID=A0A501PG75_9PROT|nr:4-(cytidine 5'-diphospho)-2-C-methyl-D-erythritol kinase [Emcibacter nanhaiensis]TPD59489.1 4-(cytidine 5'-diphospho)-2-C-methyl-D-erythritol kinase [Emcibacter nanhaiensis]
MATPPDNVPRFTEAAPAKINLDLRVTGRRADGYHLLDSLVVFADCGDRLDYYPGDGLAFEITGPFAAGLEADENNLVCRAIRSFATNAGVQVTGRFVLTKNLPVASGIGGGSADAAAALRLLTRLYPGALGADHLNEVALSLGADVPACLVSRSLRMQSVGEAITPVKLDFPLYILLANPGISVETARIFGDLKASGFSFSPERRLPREIATPDQLLSILQNSSNDLQRPACQRVPEVAGLIDEIAGLSGCLYAAMSGSGATCFGLFASLEEARSARENMSVDSKNYWLNAGTIL